MSAITHPFFGELTSDGITDQAVIWEGQYALRGVGFDVVVWLGPDNVLDAETLDGFAEVVNDLPGWDAKARRALSTYLEGERHFIDDHLENIEGSDVIDRLLGGGDAADVTAAAAVSALRLTNVGLWFDVPSAPVIMDYMFDREVSDEILAVKIALDGSVVAVDWES